MSLKPDRLYLAGGTRAALWSAVVAIAALGAACHKPTPGTYVDIFFHDDVGLGYFYLDGEYVTSDWTKSKPSLVIYLPNGGVDTLMMSYDSTELPFARLRLESLVDSSDLARHVAKVDIHLDAPFWDWWVDTYADPYVCAWLDYIDGGGERTGRVADIAAPSHDR